MTDYLYIGGSKMVYKSDHDKLERRFAELQALLREGTALLEKNHEHRALCPDEDHDWINRVKALLESP